MSRFQTWYVGPTREGVALESVSSVALIPAAVTGWVLEGNETISSAYMQSASVVQRESSSGCVWVLRAGRLRLL